MFGVGGAALTSVGDCPHSTASLVLHNFSGNGQAAISSGVYQGCAAQLGASFPQGSPGFSSGPIELSGVTFTFAQVSTSGTASGARLDIGGRNGTIGHLAGVPAVPEPASWVFLIAGFGAVGVTLRRRERLAAPLASACEFRHSIA